MQLEGKKVLVVGVARSGVAASRLLTSRGARVTANDRKEESQLAAEAEQLRALGVTLALGGHPVELFTGADLIVLSPGVPANLAPLQAARSAGVEIISEVELAARFMRGRLIAITGSNGKTTTTALTGELMRAADAHTIVGGNIGEALTGLVEKTTDDSWTVAELSSFQLETIERLRAQVAVITNITPDHLDRYRSFEDYARAKHRIFLNQTASDRAVLNGRDPGINDMIAALGVPSRKVYFSSRGRDSSSKDPAHIYVRDGRIFTTMFTDDGSEIEVLSLDEMPLPGMHNVENVMAALGGVFCALGERESEIKLLALREAVKRFKGVEHRIEFVAEIEGIRFYNDSKATNVDSTVKAIEAFERNIILILGGLDKGSDYTVLAPLISERVKQIVLIGAASDKIAGQLEGVQKMVRARSMEDALFKSKAEARAGDTVLLAPACASFDMFDNYEHRGRAFKEIVIGMAEQLQDKSKK